MFEFPTTRLTITVAACVAGAQRKSEILWLPQSHIRNNPEIIRNIPEIIRNIPEIIRNNSASKKIGNIMAKKLRIFTTLIYEQQ